MPVQYVMQCHTNVIPCGLFSWKWKMGPWKVNLDEVSSTIVGIVNLKLAQLSTQWSTQRKQPLKIPKVITGFTWTSWCVNGKHAQEMPNIIGCVLHWKASTWLPNALLATGEASGEPLQRQGAKIGNHWKPNWSIRYSTALHTKKYALNWVGWDLFWPNHWILFWFRHAIPKAFQCCAYLCNPPVSSAASSNSSSE